MEVQKIGEGTPTRVYFTAAQQAQRLAEENAAAQLKSRGVPVAVTPLDPEATTYSPTIHAQAAQFQLYTQAGTLAALLAGAVTPVAPAPAVDEDQISAVDSLSASKKFDTRA